MCWIFELNSMQDAMRSDVYKVDPTENLDFFRHGSKEETWLSPVEHFVDNVKKEKKKKGKRKFSIHQCIEFSSSLRPILALVFPCHFVLGEFFARRYLIGPYNALSRRFIFTSYVLKYVFNILHP